jgi:hypothetical protein
MVLVLKDKADIKKIQEFLSERKRKKNFDAKKFCGAIKVDEDAIVIQNRLRDEWNRYFNQI